MKFVATDRHCQHDPQFFLVKGKIGRSAEQPERAQILKSAAIDAGLECLEAKRHAHEFIEQIHSADYLRFLQEASLDWSHLAGSSPEVTANIHPNRIRATYPTGIIGRAGWHMADTACPIGPHTFQAALASADVALTAAGLVLSGESCVYALCRPPGHHAYADMAGGFCFLNNSAIAGQFLRRRYDRVAILDIDVHHGNGTQEIFYRRGDVFTVSVHRDPTDYYPHFWGYDHETGAGEGEECNLNIPLPRGSADQIWLDAIKSALESVRRFDAQALVLALGLDAHERDPLQGLAVSTEGFQQAGKLIAQFDMPTVIVQEGGYLSPDLGRNLQAFLKPF